MVYLYSEDKKGGFHLVNLLNNIYFNNKFIVESLNGIYKLERKIEDIVNTVNKKDKIIVIYDDSPGNIDVKNELESAYNIINDLDINNVYFLAIVCMEYEILTTYGIKAFANKNTHSIIDDLSKYKVNTSILKNHLHIDKRYEIYRNRVEIKVRRSHTSRCKKLNINSVLTQEELDKKITMDSICKEVMTDCFQNELIIDKADNLGRCWLERCCIKKNKICNINNRVLVEDEINAIDKQKFLVYFSRYHKLALKISEISGVPINNINNEDILKIINFTGTYFELSKYKIDDVLDYINTCWNAQEVFDRIQKN